MATTTPSVDRPRPGQGDARGDDAPLSFGESVELCRTRHTRSGSRHFERFLAGRALATVGRRDAERYLVRLSAEAAPRSVQRRVYCVRSFFSFLRGIDLVQANPFDALDLPQIDRKSETHKVLSDDELARATALLTDCERRHTS